LLRAVQEREIDRIGSNKPVKIDVRILATSNRDLEAEVIKGTFREDLLFRLNVVSLDLPPLKERPDDVLALARHFAAKYGAANGLPARGLGDDAQEKLLGYAWPGIVRELENTMHRAVLLATKDYIDAEAILLGSGKSTGAHATAPSAGAGGYNAGAMVGKTVSEVERELIINTLSHCLGNRTHAATILGISIRTLRNKLKLYNDDGVAVPAPGGDGEQASL